MVLPQGPPTPSLPVRHLTGRGGTASGTMTGSSETRPLLGSCLAPFLAIILLNQFSKTVPTHDNVPTMAGLQLESR